MTPEQANKKYSARIKRILRAIAKEFKSAGFYPSIPFEMTDSEYEFWLNIRRHRDTRKIDDSIDVTFTIIEEQEREGEGSGLAFALDVTGYGGEVYGGMCPYNYTKNLWTTDDEDLDERFSWFEQANPADIVALVERN